MPEAKKVEDLDPSWKKGAYVRSETDYYEEESEEDLEFAWFAVKSNQQETPEEIEERKKAIEYQIKNGILQPNGLPTGMKMPEKPKPKMNKFARKAMRQQQRDEEKRRKQLQRQQQVPLTPAMRKLI